MVLVANGFDEVVVHRILEFCDASTPWSRRLWQSGSVLLGRELLEAGDPASNASEHAVKQLQDELLNRLGLDLGLCAPRDRAVTRQLISAPSAALVKPGHAWQTLSAWLSLARSSYLINWADVFSTPGSVPPSAESVARLLAAHLIDEGFSVVYLHRWLTYRVKHSPQAYTLASLCRELESEWSAEPKTFEILLPLAAHAPLPRPAPSGWLTPDQTKKWRAEKIPGAQPIRQYGALVLTVRALDKYAAANMARDRLNAFRDRFRLGGRHEVSVNEAMWIAGDPHSLSTSVQPRMVQIYAFTRQAALWDHSIRGDLEAAMELVAPLERGPAPAAVTGAWAALEGLLVGAGDDAKHVVAGRLAAILASGHLRAEMTSLAWAHARATSDTLARTIRSCSTNQERASEALAFMIGGASLHLIRDEDKRAAQRLSKALADPYEYVVGVRRSVEPVIRGLYRQRNLLSHAGGTRGVALKPTLERAAPLVAAGMDRIVHAALTSGRSAIELAASASVRTNALRGSAPDHVLRVLDPSS